MNDQNDQSVGEGDEKGAGKLPGVGEPVWVQCSGFRIMAYRDEDGAWRILSSGKKLDGKVEVIREA